MIRGLCEVFCLLACIVFFIISLYVLLKVLESVHKIDQITKSNESSQQLFEQFKNIIAEHELTKRRSIHMEIDERETRSLPSGTSRESQTDDSILFVDFETGSDEVLGGDSVDFGNDQCCSPPKYLTSVNTMNKNYIDQALESENQHFTDDDKRDGSLFRSLSNIKVTVRPFTSELPIKMKSRITTPNVDLLNANGVFYSRGTRDFVFTNQHTDFSYYYTISDVYVTVNITKTGNTRKLVSVRIRQFKITRRTRNCDTFESYAIVFVLALLLFRADLRSNSSISFWVVILFTSAHPQEMRYYKGYFMKSSQTYEHPGFQYTTIILMCLVFVEVMKNQTPHCEHFSYHDRSTHRSGNHPSERNRTRSAAAFKTKNFQKTSSFVGKRQFDRHCIKTKISEINPADIVSVKHRKMVPKLATLLTNNKADLTEPGACMPTSGMGACKHLHTPKIHTRSRTRRLPYEKWKGRVSCRITKLALMKALIKVYYASMIQRHSNQCTNFGIGQTCDLKSQSTNGLAKMPTDLWRRMCCNALVYVLYSQSESIAAKFQDERSRFRSYENYRGNGDKSVLARDGFYHCQEIGPNFTKCFACSTTYDGWTKDCNVAEVHKQLSPKCPFIIRTNGPSQNADSGCHQPEHDPHNTEYQITGMSNSALGALGIATASYSSESSLGHNSVLRSETERNASVVQSSTISLAHERQRGPIVDLTETRRLRIAQQTGQLDGAFRHFPVVIICHGCNVRRANIVLLPCRHLVICDRCVEGFIRCPVCDTRNVDYAHALVFW